MSPLSLISLIVALPTVALTALDQLSLWQRKEYRLDRFFSHLIEQITSRRLMLSASPVVVWLLALFLHSAWLSLLVIFFFGGFYLRRTLTHGIYRPVPTAKLLLIAATLFVYLAILFTIAVALSYDLSLKLSTLILIVYPLTALVVFLVNLVTNPQKKKTIAQATALRRSLKSLRVIGVTGSVGKTTTKHILSQLMPNATVSQQHRNSDYVIAQDMLEQLDNKTLYYIVEMSAYRKGEIADLARLAQPNIGVITEISNQHQALFGSKRHILQAKWELIDALPADGIAVLNADNALLKQKSTTCSQPIIWFSKSSATNIYANQINVQADQLRFTLHIKNKQYSVTTRLLSLAYLNSILAAVGAAHAAGLADQDIVKRINHLTPYPRTMELCVGINGSQVIDDSYSASKLSALNAIDHLAKFTQADKRIIMVPLIELGSAAADVHRQIGEALRNSQAKVFIYGLAHHQYLKQPFFARPDKLLAQATQNITSDTVFLLEGRVPEIIRSSLLQPD